MRLFHFVNDHFGLRNLRKRRLKIATIADLNDPFELLSISLASPSLREPFRRWKERLGKRVGMLCFSRGWNNSVMWSHYAERHAGLCLAFEIPDDLARKVTYTTKRLASEAEQLLSQGPNFELMMKFLSTKHNDWNYEHEERVFFRLDPSARDPKTGLFFANFSEQLKLTGVIVGAESRLTRKAVGTALGTLAPTVSATKAQLSFRSFRVVLQQNQRQWV